MYYRGTLWPDTGYPNQIYNWRLDQALACAIEGKHEKAQRWCDNIIRDCTCPVYQYIKALVISATLDDDWDPAEQKRLAAQSLFDTVRSNWGPVADEDTEWQMEDLR